MSSAVKDISVSGRNLTTILSKQQFSSKNNSVQKTIMFRPLLCLYHLFVQNPILCWPQFSSYLDGPIPTNYGTCILWNFGKGILFGTFLGWKWLLPISYSNSMQIGPDGLIITKFCKSERVPWIRIESAEYFFLPNFFFKAM